MDRIQAKEYSDIDIAIDSKNLPPAVKSKLELNYEYAENFNSLAHSYN